MRKAKWLPVPACAEAEKKFKLGYYLVGPCSRQRLSIEGNQNPRELPWITEGTDVHPSYREMMQLLPGVEFATQ